MPSLVMDGLFSALCLGRRWLFGMLMPFGSYADEFGSPKDPNLRVMGIVGLLSWSDNWTKFQSEWTKLQKAEGIPNPFHMVDFVHQKEDFATGWDSETRRLEILGRLLNLISEARTIPIAAAVVLKDFYALTPAQQSALKNPYHVAFEQVSFQLAFAATMKALEEKPENPVLHPVSMVFAKLKKYTGPAGDQWEAIKAAHPLIAPWMSSYTPGEPKDYAPVQAADIWAWTLSHVHEHRPPKKKEAEIAFEFFVKEARREMLGQSFYEVFDAKKFRIRFGEPPE